MASLGPLRKFHPVVLGKAVSAQWESLLSATAFRLACSAFSSRRPRAALWIECVGTFSILNLAH